MAGAHVYMSHIQEFKINTIVLGRNFCHFCFALSGERAGTVHVHERVDKTDARMQHR